jgi:polar amino acid transport system substrate-binding protein
MAPGTSPLWKASLPLAGRSPWSRAPLAEQNLRRAQPQAVIVPFETYPEAFAALKQGKVEAMASDSGILLGLRCRDENPGDWELVGEPLSAAPYAIGLPENDSKFRDLFNVALMELWESGEY